MLAVAKFFCVNFLIIVCLIKSILGDCDILFPENPSLSPTYYMYIGSHKLKTNINGSDVLRLHEEQKVEAHCYNHFEQPTYYKTSNKLNIRCQGSSVYTSTDSYRGNEKSYYRPRLECSPSKWRLYESSDNFTWCPPNVTSYLVAKPQLSNTSKSGFSYEIAGRICYDIYTFSFYSVYFTVGAKQTQSSHPYVLENLYEPRMQIKYIDEVFGSNSISENIYDNKQAETWITQANYNFSSIAQYHKLRYLFHDHISSLLEILWWRNLRLYNWHHYIQALEKHIADDNEIYVLAGVSGAVQAPILDDCSKNYSMEEVLYNTNENIPLYIWNYLQHSGNSSNEIVVIGFNSPFYELYAEEDVIFCPDKCQEIDWLKEVSSSFHYGIMGIVFCCDVADVRLSDHLYGFPENDIKWKSID